MKMYYVYALIDPRTTLPFYIGKGKEGTNRHKRHMYETEQNTENKHKFFKIQHFKKRGYDIPVKVLSKGLTETEAYDLETKLIEYYGRINIDENGILTNICLIAQPPSMKGKRRKREGVEKYIKSRRGRCFLTEEDKKQISLKLKGRKQSDETKQRRRKTLEKIPHAYGRKNWLFISPKGESFLLKTIGRSSFCKEHNISISACFFKYLNTGTICKTTAPNSKNNGWMFFNDETLITNYITVNNIVPIIL